MKQEARASPCRAGGLLQSQPSDAVSEGQMSLFLGVVLGLLSCSHMDVIFAGYGQLLL